MKLIDCLARRFNKSVGAKTKSRRFSGALAMAFAVAAQGFLGAEASADIIELRWFFDQNPRLINTNIDKDHRVVVVRVRSEPEIISPRMPPPVPFSIKVSFNKNITCSNGRAIEAHVITNIGFELPSDYGVNGPVGVHYGFTSLAAVKIGSAYYAILRCENDRLSFVYIAQ
jgi:hypothetical protein